MPAVKKASDIERKPYRVVTAGASYLDPTDALGPDGEPTVLQVYRVGHFGEEVQLVEAQANRLLDLGVVKPASEPRSYQEQTVEELTALASERGIDVKGSGANGAVLKDDLVNAHQTFDQGQSGS